MMHFDDATAWAAWLDGHHDADEAWLMIAKKKSDAVSITVREALDVALCYGWIDSHRRSYDDRYYLQRYSPRRRGSAWSRVNVERVEALMDAGRVRAPGLAQVEAARADGRWESACAAQRDATVPPDLAEALAAHPEAAARFAELDRTSRYGLILPLLKARTPAGRAARLDRALSGLLAG